ncbi:hypothetical protein [Nocardia sputi]|uniref:hypothetical protein n=1 Tax=Nocardia sputi TaxID=2943705 RepID=UPI0020BD6BF3|nr:hypothetical protein [Nocardia sputi]
MHFQVDPVAPQIDVVGAAQASEPPGISIHVHGHLRETNAARKQQPMNAEIVAEQPLMAQIDLVPSSATTPIPMINYWRR